MIVLVVLPITGCDVIVFINPADPVHTEVTVTETSTAGLNSTVQVRVTADPAAMVPLAMVIVGIGTTGEYENMQCLCQLLTMLGDDQTLLLTGQIHNYRITATDDNWLTE